LIVKESLMLEEKASSKRVQPMDNNPMAAPSAQGSSLPPNPGLGRRKSFSDRRDVKAQTFERKSVKFWVPVHRVTAVIDIVKKFIPVSRRGVVHSIYFDNDESSVYSARLFRQDGSQLLRFRWYGDDQPSEKSSSVFIETKTHNNDRPSVKERFSLTPASADSFESGVDDEEVEKLGEKARGLAKKARKFMSERKLHRVLRTEYYRCV
jgi:SPX domain protein involved in polyphosphate accumulation